MRRGMCSGARACPLAPLAPSLGEWPFWLRFWRVVPQRPMAERTRRMNVRTRAVPVGIVEILSLHVNGVRAPHAAAHVHLGTCT